MEEEKKEEEKKADAEDEGPNGCIICLQATWDVIYVSVKQVLLCIESYPFYWFRVYTQL